MEIKLVLEECYYVKSRDRIGGTVRTDVFKHEDGLFHTFSSYAQDREEEIVGHGESYDDKEAIRLSRESLRKEWTDTRNQIKENALAFNDPVRFLIQKE